jgi:hypothetical protein
MESTCLEYSEDEFNAKQAAALPDQLFNQRFLAMTVCNLEKNSFAKLPYMLTSKI